MAGLRKIHQIAAQVVHNYSMTEDIGTIRVESPEIAEIARPGQFIMIHLGNALDPLLRRPFSIKATYDSKYIDVVYRVIGKGTALLSKIKERGFLDIVGPLGHGFELKEEGRQLLVAGGMGVAPLFFLTQHMVSSGAKDRIAIFLGARTKGEIFCIDELESMGIEVKIATEDGSQGEQGLVIDLITKERIAQKPSVYSCGPYGMLRAASRLALEYGLSCQVSLESYMACGIGACLGCVAEMKDRGLARVCKEGPVFEAQEVLWR